MEQWKTIETHENYAVSTMGNIKNIKFDRPVKPFADKNGYMVVNLYKNGKMETKKVHRIVLSAFTQNTEGKEQVNHLNGVKSDNRLVNLEWSTNSENQRHRRIVLGKNGGGLHQKKVRCVELNVVFASIMDAERKTGVHHQHISKCMNGKRKCAGGMHWEIA